MSGSSLAAAVIALAMAAPATSPTLKTDRRLQALTGATIGEKLEQAAVCLDEGPSVLLAELTIDAAVLRRLAAAVKLDHPTRALREQVGRAVDPDDFVRLLDDVCHQRGRDDLPELLVVSPGRGRAAGVLVHPKEVFGDAQLHYGDGEGELAVDMPLDYRTLERPEDGAPIGPRWAARYLEPQADADKLAALSAANPDFGQRVEHLVKQLRDQGAYVQIESAVRSRERGFLLYGAFILGRASTEAELAKRIRKLDRLKEAWKLDVPIAWRHPGDWRQTVEAARRLADTYGVVYATVGGARRSRHYGGDAVDLVAVALPRTLELEAPDGAKAVFDLSDVDHTRDLSLAPELIEWVEAHYGVRKLKRDYPHWDDAK